MSLSFDSSFYQAQRPDVYDAFIATAGSTGLTWAQFAQNHYNTFGRFEGSDPSASFDTSYYLETYPDVAAAGVNPFDHFLSNGSLEQRVPYNDFPASSFVPATYAAANPDLAAAGLTTDGQLYQHWVIHGQFEGRTGAPDVSTPSAGSTFTLTSAVDTITGTNFDDTINGVMDNATASNNTFSIVDTIDGAAGTDTLNVIVNAAAANDDVPVSAVTNVEQFYVRNITAVDVDFNAAGQTAITQIWSDRSTGSLDIDGMAAGVTVGVQGDGTTTNANVTADYVATATAAALAVTGGTTAGAVDFGGAGLTSATITGVGNTANTLGTIDVAGATAVTVTSAGNLTTGNITTTGTNGTLTVSGTGAINLATLAAGIDTVDASGNSGGFTLILDGETDTTVTGGTGNDSFTTGAALGTGSVNAGDGTDTLIQAATAHINSTTLGAKYTNFETLQVNNGVTVDLDNYTGSTLTAVNVLETGGGATVNDMNATQGGAVTLLGAANGTITLGISGATGVGQLDTLAITVSDGDTTTSENIGAYTHTSLGIETLNFTATDDLTINSMAATTGVTSLTVTGAGNASITTGAMAVSANLGVDFSGLTGANTFDASASTGNPFAFTGGSGVDTITDGVTGGNVLNGGAGNDVITLTDKTGGSATTTVNGGAGADAITTNMIGNTAIDAMLFQYAAGDSVSDSSTTGISTTLTDTIANLDGATLAAAAGAQAEFDTEVQATAVTAGATAVNFGVTTVTNAGDFFVHIANATTTYIYQDTDGDGIIESGEFAVALTGIQTDTLQAGDFTVAGGDLILATT
ncbi:beta strand repeat-containing protein [Roseibium sp. MB-4]